MEVSQIKVRLQQYRGVTQTAVGPLEVDQPQKIVFVSLPGHPERYAGYAPDDPKSHISIILPNLPQVVLDEIKRQVDAQRGTVSPAISQVKRLEESDVVVEAVEESDGTGPAESEELV